MSDAFADHRPASKETSVGTVVLAVDDNEDNLSIVTSLLVPRGFDVRVARDGRTALEAVAAQHPDVILLDVMMPGMSGYEILDHLRADARTASIPVIMLTARAQNEDVLAGYRLGADYYITRPFTVKQLLYGICHVLGRELHD